MDSTRLDHSALIGLDWGTSSLRAYRLDAEGRVLDSRHLPWGVMRLPQGGFEQAFDAACGDWLSAEPSLPVIACGMVGSAQGWQEAPYVPLSCDVQRLARSIATVERPAGGPVHIVPGVIQHGVLPNVMRGEETQAFGVLDTVPLQPGETLLVGLPGTHSKWVAVRDGELLHFETFMTGEVFAALRGHTILGKTMQEGGAGDNAAFRQGLAVAMSDDGAWGVLSNIFSCRTLGLVGDLAPTAQADYLSGLLIGHEMAALVRAAAGWQTASRVVLCGEQELCRRYGEALEMYGVGIPLMAPQATVYGLWRLALSAGLIVQ